MRLLSILLLLFAVYFAQAQPHSFESLLQQGKAEFKQEKPNYKAAARALEAAIKLQPSSAEAHYYLGYTYSRLNNEGGATMNQMRLALVRKASQEMEMVNRLAPHYTGDLLPLDPYGKITSEWGALAVGYATRQQDDSARWAFAQGRLRGGFSDFLVGHARALLDQCRPAGILLSPGDLITFPLAYVQLVNHYRVDVSVVDVALLATTWYPAYLEKTTSLRFGMPAAARDTVAYMPWHTGPWHVFNARLQTSFTWQLHPTYDSTYLQRPDILLLALLQANEFRRDVYFTHAFQESAQLSLRLNQELLQRWIVYQVNASGEPEPATAEYLTHIVPVLDLVAKANSNSRNEVAMILGLRYDLLDRLQRSLQVGRSAEVKPLLALVDHYLSEATYPFESPEEKAFYKYAKTLQ
ncbi:tetratricopeptide repeat protein [Hymenobacter cheonanensis]|uniref:tetratricopeptide repeat protein n=1 Tax=Hymenobacter sp. CA2-7 TaxID=3063993 RepID=UPI002712CCD3|nr:tetratricopeptide repeat protein [Hymenobacter sp. CA2-7]MDO7888153.1 tetratricopeptide repeat protein [Hymenobacter sp. CA2-7]